MSTSNEYKEGASISNDDVCEVNTLVQKLSTADTSVCANCGKEGANNICNKCKMVKYCNAVCKKKHRKKHKKECEEHIKLAAERAAELHDVELFKQPPPEEDCPICFLLLPSFPTGRTYMSCCGKVICNGCICAPLYDNQGNKINNKKCPFCRTVAPKSDEEIIEEEKKRVEAGDAQAIHNLGWYHRDGEYGYSQDYTKALELFRRAGELGLSMAYNNIGNAYSKGRGVEVDKKKAKHYYELAAMKGCMYSRHNLGLQEARAGNMDRALKHFMIAAASGYDKSLDYIKKFYSKGYATKEDYTKGLQLYQTYLAEIKSDQRDKAAATDEDYRYY